MADRTPRTANELQALLRRFDETYRHAEDARRDAQRSLLRRACWPDRPPTPEDALDPPDNDQSA